MAKPYSPYVQIGPSGLEKRLGVRAGILRNKTKGKRYSATGPIDYNAEGEMCLSATINGHLAKVPIRHGDLIRIRCNGRGDNSIRDYIFIDESD